MSETCFGQNNLYSSGYFRAWSDPFDSSPPLSSANFEICNNLITLVALYYFIREHIVNNLRAQTTRQKYCLAIIAFPSSAFRPLIAGGLLSLF